ncbi:MAG: hypothetical protein JXA73_07430 [Acidobacteria bacterium]|nr:hypothetical protein [Acidobacteriota bacterium]
MKKSMEQDPRITRELGSYRLAPPSPDLHDRVLRAAREAMASEETDLHRLDRWLQALATFREEILTYASALLLLMGIVMQFGGGQNVLADTVERVKLMVTISGRLHRATSMDCTVLKKGAGGETFQYRLRWSAAGVTRVDMESPGAAGQTLWISNGTVSAAQNDTGTMSAADIDALPSKWQLSIEFLTPTILAQHMEMRYGLRQAERPESAGTDRFLLIGRENQQVVEIAVDAMNYLPATLKKFSADSAPMGKDRDCLEDVRFQWNKSIPQELFIPASSSKRQVN